MGMFETLGILSKYKINPEKFQNCLCAIQSRYLDNPYHNFRHALDTAQAAYYMIAKCGLKSQISLLDVLALFIAALAHDIGHMGRSNPFLIETSDPLAVVIFFSPAFFSYHCHCSSTTMRRH